MKKIHQLLKKIKDQQGAAAIVVAIALVFFLIGFAALAVDVGYLFSTKNELQNISDSAALSATAELGNQYFNDETINATDIRNVAVEIGNKNWAGDKASISIALSDIEIGKWDQDADPKFVPNDSDPFVPTGDEDAVRVTARRDSDPNGNGPVATFFARIFGADTANVSTDAIADLSGASEIVEGGLPIPVGIAEVRFKDPDWCWQPIKFYPTNDIEACGGWHVYDYDTYLIDKTKIKQDILDGLLASADPPFVSPETNTDSTFYFKGGTDNAAYEILKQIFDERKIINDYWQNPPDNTIPKEWPLDGDEDPNTWTTTVVVYGSDDCSNPNTDLPIVGFSTIRIYEICTATSDPSVQITGGGGNLGAPPPQDFCVSGEKQIVARISCNVRKPVRGGGGEFGIMGTIPGLVE